MSPSRLLVAIGFAAFSFASSSLPALAADGAISGIAVTVVEKPVDGARVTLVELRRRTQTDANGAFRFDSVTPGHYHVQVVSARWGTAVAEVDVVEGTTTDVRVRIDLGVHLATVVVTASADPRSLSEVAQPIAILDGSRLQERAQATLGETLAQEPGVSSNYYAPGASRPVIRGLGGDRIRILEDGVGTADASNLSPDHAVSYDPLGAERIEIVRGAAALLYGTNAVGGVVNVLDGRIPDHVPASPIEGSASLRYATAADERAGAVDLIGGADRFAWHAGWLERKSADLDAPGGSISNSDVVTTRGTVGGSYVGSKGFAGLAFTGFDTNYGSAVEKDVRIDMKQRRFDLRGEFNARGGFLRTMKVRAGAGDYQHVELESEEAGTRFTNKNWEARGEFVHRAFGRFNGAFGVQLSERDFESEGEEAYVQPTFTKNQALFLFEQVGTRSLHGEFGARYERQQNDSSDPGLRDRDFRAPSGSAGAVWKRGDAWSFAAFLARSTRLPTPEELYSNGPHLATLAYEIGDDSLSKETSLGLDLSVRKLTGRFRGELNLFWDAFDDYIYDRFTGVYDPGEDPLDPDDDLPIFLFSQQDAEFRGLEAVGHIELLHTEPHHLELDLRYDTVRAEFSDGNPLPRIPAAKYGVALHYRGAKLWANVELLRTETQNRVSRDPDGDPLETPTAGYSWINAAAGYRIIAGRTVHDFILRGVNLTDKLGRNHGSRFKDVVALTGRDLSFSYRLTF